MKIFSLLAVAIGEVLTIIAEVLGAKYYSQTNFFPVFIKLILVFTIGGMLLIYGYSLGYVSYKKNIWIISAISVTTILIIEPMVALLLFKQTPTFGALIGFILGAIGLVITIFL